MKTSMNQTMMSLQGMVEAFSVVERMIVRTEKQMKYTMLWIRDRMNGDESIVRDVSERSS